MKHRLTFSPDRIAYLETQSWVAYYDRDWLGMARVLVAIHREEFGMSLPDALLATVRSTRAAVAFAPLDRSDPEKARRLLIPYYRRVRSAIGATAAAETLAVREIDYWVVHRRLAIARKADPTASDPESPADIEPMVETFARLHAALFNSTPERMRASAEYRALAAKAVDRITGGYSPDIPADWARVEAYLRQAYRAVAAELPEAPPKPGPARMEATP